MFKSLKTTFRRGLSSAGQPMNWAPYYIASGSSKANNIIEQQHRRGFWRITTTGDGSTGWALQYEAIHGVEIGGKTHKKKLGNDLKGLNKALVKEGSFAERDAVERLRNYLAACAIFEKTYKGPETLENAIRAACNEFAGVHGPTDATAFRMQTYFVYRTPEIKMAIIMALIGGAMGLSMYYADYEREADDPDEF